MVFEGFESFKLGLQIVGPWLSYVHVKNARPVIQGADQYRRLIYGYEWCPLRQGMVDWKSVLDALNDIGFDGWLSLEDFTSSTTPDQKLSEFVDLFSALL
jgi:sugar phosphate isomerase/epimerase